MTIIRLATWDIFLRAPQGSDNGLTGVLPEPDKVLIMPLEDHTIFHLMERFLSDSHNPITCLVSYCQVLEMTQKE